MKIEKNGTQRQILDSKIGGRPNRCLKVDENISRLPTGKRKQQIKNNIK